MPSQFQYIRSLEKLSQPDTKAKIVRGKVPSWIAGTLYRNGPGKFEFEDKEYKHLFDGHACVHRFKVENGEVVYSNRVLPTRALERTLNEKRLFPMFGTADLCTNVFGRYKSFFFEKGSKMVDDNTNVNIMPFGNEHLYALTESNIVCKLDPVTLEIVERINVRKAVPSASTTIAHPHMDERYEPGSWYTMGMSIYNSPASYEFIVHKLVADANNNTNDCKLQEHSRLLASIPSSHTNKRKALSYSHSFGLSEHYLIFLEQSLTIDFEQYFYNIMWNKPFSECISMDAKLPTRIHLINRQTGEVTKQRYHTDSLFVFHHINAVETSDNKIHVDLIAYEAEGFDINNLTYRGTFETFTFNSRSKRIVVDLAAEATGESIYCEIKPIGQQSVAVELPTINYGRYNTGAYKYFYAVNYDKRPYSVVKTNVDDASDVREISFVEEADEDKDGNKKEEEESVTYLPSEPVFIERPGATSEDDGVLLTMVMSDHNDFLSILDAKDLTEIARAQLDDGVKAALTFHGFFQPAAAATSSK